MNTVGQIKGAGVLSRLNFLSSSFLPVKNKTTTTILGTCITFLEENLVRYRGSDYIISVNVLNNQFLPCKINGHIALYSIHNNEDITYKITSAFELVMPHVRILYGISAKRFKRLNRTDAPCNTELFVNQCEKKCIEDFLKTQIQCRLPFMPFHEIPLCDNFTFAHININKALKIAVSFSYSNNCVCPKICDQVQIKNNLKNIMFDGHSMIQMFFDDDVIDTIEEYYVYSFISLLCDVGGNLGLFLGLCVPTLLSILQSVISIIVKKIVY